MKQNKARRFWLSCLGLALSLIILVPFYTIIINSFKNTREAAQANLSLPTQWCILENYAEMFRQGRLGSAFRNSVLLTVPCVLAVIALSSVSAFILQRRHSRASSTLSIFIVLACSSRPKSFPPISSAIICIFPPSSPRGWYCAPPTFP